MTDNHDERIAQLFDGAEIALPDEGFSARVMLRVSRFRRLAAILRYGSWVVALLCCVSVLPLFIGLSLRLGDTIGSLPVLLMNSRKPLLRLPAVLIALTPVVGFLILKMRLPGLPRR